MSYVVLRSRFPAIVSSAAAGTAEAVARCVDRIEQKAKDKSRVDTGNMRAGWTGEMLESNAGRVFNLVDYTIYNEYGTAFMSAQPMLRPAIEESADEFIDELKEAWPG